MSINERQNSDLNLKRLAAQRQLYSDAKKLTQVQFVFSGIALIVFAIIGNIISTEHAVYITVMAFLCVLYDEFFLTKGINDRKINAARIQEDFDCEVLQIPQNHIKNSQSSMFEKVQEYSDKHLLLFKNYDLLKNWYPGIDKTELRYGKILCQSTNCWWNQKLRESYSKLLLICTLIIFILLLIIALSQGITLKSFIMSVIAPILPGVFLVYKIYRDNKKAIENLNHMKSKLDDIIERLKNKKEYPDDQLNNDVRCLQDMIFDNRSVSPLIPDKFYFRNRDRYEKIAEATNSELVGLLKTRIVE